VASSVILERELGREKVSDQLRKYQEYFSAEHCAKKVLSFVFLNDSHVILASGLLHREWCATTIHFCKANVEGVVSCVERERI